MSRQGRLLVIVIAIAVLGLIALAGIAQRYRGLGSDEAAGEEQARVDAVESSDEARLADLKAFVSGRRAVRALMDEHPHAFQSFYAELTDTIPEGQEQVKMFGDVSIELRLKRGAAIQEAGSDENRYRAVREHYRAWKLGEGQPDPEWVKMFEADPDLIAEADLGDYEMLDPERSDRRSRPNQDRSSSSTLRSSLSSRSETFRRRNSSMPM